MFGRYLQSNNKGIGPNLYMHVTSLYTHVINFTLTHVLQMEILKSEDITLLLKKINNYQKVVCPR
jgi:hypothetical protein